MTSRRYASTTTVSSEKSRAEIETLLKRYGADQFLYGWKAEEVVIGFRMRGLVIRLILPLPRKDDEQFAMTPQTHRRRSPVARHEVWEQATRQAWRALLLILKAKMEAIEAGIVLFEQEFLGYMVLPDNTTVSQWMLPQVAEAYDAGRMPKMLVLPPSSSPGV